MAEPCGKKSFNRRLEYRDCVVMLEVVVDSCRHSGHINISVHIVKCRELIHVTLYIVVELWLGAKHKPHFIE